MPRSYSIVAPKTFRTGSIYNMTVSCYRATSNVFMTIRLTGLQNGSLVEQTEVLANGLLFMFEFNFMISIAVLVTLL